MQTSNKKIFDNLVSRTKIYLVIILILLFFSLFISLSSFLDYGGKIVNVYYKDLGYDNVEFVRYPNYGHSGTPGIQHTTELILKYRSI